MKRRGNRGKRKKPDKQRYFNSGVYRYDGCSIAEMNNILKNSTDGKIEENFNPEPEPVKEVKKDRKEIVCNDDFLHYFMDTTGRLLQLYVDNQTTDGELFLTDPECARILDVSISTIERAKRILRNEGYITKCIWREDLKEYSFLLLIQES